MTVLNVRCQLYLRQAQTSHEHVWPSQFSHVHNSQLQTAFKTADLAFVPMPAIASALVDFDEVAPQPHASHVQLSPSQSRQAQAATAFDDFALMEQHSFVELAAIGVIALVVVADCPQPQFPHWQSVHVQTPDEQSGQRQSVQPQADFPFSDVDPENAKAQVAPIVKAVSMAGIAKLFMVDLLTKMVLNQIKKRSCNFLKDSIQPSAVDREQQRSRRTRRNMVLIRPG